MFLPGECQGQRSLQGDSERDHTELIATEVTKHAQVRMVKGQRQLEKHSYSNSSWFSLFQDPGGKHCLPVCKSNYNLEDNELGRPHKMEPTFGVRKQHFFYIY